MNQILSLRAAARAVLAGAIAVSAALAQPPAKPPVAFEVASVKPSPPMDPAKLIAGKMHIGMSIEPARIDFGYTPLVAVIYTAYRIKLYQVSGPAWIKNTYFDITATYPEGATKDQAPEMLQALLADRFKMTFHRETKEQSEYNLVIGKGGSKLKPAEPDTPEDAPPSKADENAVMNTTIPTPDGPVHIVARKDGTGSQRGPTGNFNYAMKGTMMHFEATKINMKGLCDFIGQFTGGKPVFDSTNLTGNYQLSMDFSLEELMALARASGALPPEAGGGPQPGSGPAAANAAPEASSNSIFTTLQQYGLKLTPQKTPTEFLVVDHIEKTPTEN